MSADNRAATRYARALFGLALQRNEIDDVARSIAQVAQTVQSSPDLVAVLHHPRITRSRKKELLAQVFAGQIGTNVQNFLSLLIEKDRATLIPEAAREFERLLDEHRHEADAEAVSAVPLTEVQREALLQRLQATTGYKVRLTTRVDDSILGGLVVRVGDKLIDGSVATQLNHLREQLRQAKVT
jgi:F-type H+-transporting ATPase subunit delta